MTERRCRECRYWSQMIARAGGAADNPRGDTEALCLGAGPRAGKHTVGTDTCSAFAVNTHGAVDEPPDFGEKARAAYGEGGY